MDKTNVESESFDSFAAVHKVATILWLMGTLLLATMSVLTFVKGVVERLDNPYKEFVFDPDVEERTAKPSRPCGCDE